MASWIHGKGRNFCSGSDKQEIQVSYQKIQMGKKLALEYNVQDTIRIFQTKEIILKNNQSYMYTSFFKIIFLNYLLENPNIGPPIIGHLGSSLL